MMMIMMRKPWKGNQGDIATDVENGDEVICSYIFMHPRWKILLEEKIKISTQEIDKWLNESFVCIFLGTITTVI